MCAPTEIPHHSVAVACLQCRDARVEIAQLRARLRLTELELRTMTDIAGRKEDHLEQVRAELCRLEAERVGFLDGRADVALKNAGLPSVIPLPRQGDPVMPAGQRTGFDGCD
jgi:hypothetical protein